MFNLFKKKEKENFYQSENVIEDELFKYLLIPINDTKSAIIQYFIEFDGNSVYNYQKKIKKSSKTEQKIKQSTNNKNINKDTIHLISEYITLLILKISNTYDIDILNITIDKIALQYATMIILKICQNTEDKCDIQQVHTIKSAIEILENNKITKDIIDNNNTINSFLKSDKLIKIINDIIKEYNKNKTIHEQKNQVTNKSKSIKFNLRFSDNLNDQPITIELEKIKYNKLFIIVIFAIVAELIIIQIHKYNTNQNKKPNKTIKNTTKQPNMRKDNKKTPVKIKDNTNIIKDNKKTPVKIKDNTNIIKDNKKTPFTIKDNTNKSNIIKDNKKTPVKIKDNTNKSNIIKDNKKTPFTIKNTTKKPNIRKDNKKTPVTIKDNTNKSNIIKDNNKTPVIIKDNKNIAVKTDLNQNQSTKTAKHTLHNLINKNTPINNRSMIVNNLNHLKIPNNIKNIKKNSEKSSTNSTNNIK